MKEFFASLAAVIVIGILAAAILGGLDSSSAESFLSVQGTTRL